MSDPMAKCFSDGRMVPQRDFVGIFHEPVIFEHYVERTVFLVFCS